MIPCTARLYSLRQVNGQLGFFSFYIKQDHNSEGAVMSDKRVGEYYMSVPRRPEHG
jgi:hypothetical protein